MIRKKGKQLMIKDKKNFNTISGTVDNKKPKSLYINLSAWSEPLIDDETLDYKSIIKDLSKRVKIEVFNNLDSKLFHKNKYIVDFDMRESGIMFGKKSFISCEITLYQLHSFKIQENEIQDSLDLLIDKIIENVFNMDIYFNYSKTK